MVFLMAILTSLSIPLNVEGVITEMGKDLFAKILIGVVYICSWVINSPYKAMYLSHTLLK